MSATTEWVDKAEGDYHSAIALRRLRSRPEPDNVCYLSQQCAEKYLKAYLLDRGLSPPRIHDLVGLLNECEVYEPALSTLTLACTILNQYSVHIRYPGMSATVSEANVAIESVRRIRRTLRKLLRM